MLLVEKLLGSSSASEPVYIEDVFSAYLYTGTGSAQTITNGIDLSTKGGMVWLKGRSAADPAWIMDTTRGTSSTLQPSSANPSSTITTAITAFNTTGFTLGTNLNSNTNGNTYVSWTFRKQAKFFDVVTWLGDGTGPTPRNISHNLGSIPGCIIAKAYIGSPADWYAWHQSVPGNSGALNGATIFNQTNGVLGTSSNSFTVGTNLNVNSVSYVAYIFAHNAGGFGLNGTDNVITCGSYTGNGSATGPSITLGYEPQWILIKGTQTATNWNIFDTMRGLTVSGSSDAYLRANSTAAEATADWIAPTATGFTITTTSTELNSNAANYAYVAIRRGPMRTPTTGTSVFSPNTSSAASGTKITTNFPVDAQLGSDLVGTSNRVFVDRLRGISTNATGAGQRLLTNSTAAEATDTGTSLFWDNTGFQMPANFGGASAVFWNFRRAPGFFDVVCYTGTGSAQTINHNLGVAPELILEKCRNNLSSTQSWSVYAAPQGATKNGVLNSTAAFTGQTIWNNTAPTASVFSINGGDHQSGDTYVAYLFATLAGVSKVGSYTGSGTTKQIDCGFTGGARFVLIKRTDDVGDWYLWDSARGIVAGNDPYVLINSNVAEVTGTDYIDTYSAGFEISSTAPAAINANGGSFIFLAIA